ncbi:NADP-dependent oxidoreductase [Pseudomarimonas arenosa]|uniref:NADP-dependent oxidoreductase n=1 Tax=Pseudomarimonas arenosa TaxID=2774145 RepID=A0AAW3ZR82_9GAMM|nr:NADP-dependent oxidoreductase [Pseudomarimonas arenosa]MBD8526766.1 NADP-dependent oxidoreductase [Pseudomarimonas arenosa]
MRAWLLDQYADPRRALRLAECPAPRLSEDELRIDIRASSINPIDYKMARGELRSVQKLRFPVCLGFDLAGVVLECGPAVSGFAVGDRVLARSDRQRLGAFAEQVCIPAAWVARLPEALPFAEAASLPLVGLTTLQGLSQRAAARRGESILIQAGTGGVGSFALQYAKAIGLHVTTTCSSRNQALARELGADEVICYDRQDYRATTQRFDLVYDLLGGEHTLASFDLLKAGGAVVSIAGPPDRQFAEQAGLRWWLKLLMPLVAGKVWKRAERSGYRYFRFLTEPNGEQLKEIISLVEQGRIKPQIDSRFRFEQLPQAMAEAMKGHARGKLVVERCAE